MPKPMTWICLALLGLSVAAAWAVLGARGTDRNSGERPNAHILADKPEHRDSPDTKSEGISVGELPRASLKQPKPTVQAAYSARSVAQLLEGAEQLPTEFSADVIALEEAAAKLCLVAVDPATMAQAHDTFVGVYRHLALAGIVVEHPDLLSSYQWVDDYRDEFCGVSPAIQAQTYQQREARRLAIEEYALLRAAEQARSDGSEGDPRQSAGVAMDILISTSSPAMFREAAYVLAATSDWSLPGYTPRRTTIGGQEEVRTLGADLAYCQLLVGGCGPGSLLAINYCMPSNCRRGESVFDFLGRTQSPDLMDQASEYANALLRLRRNGG